MRRWMALLTVLLLIIIQLCGCKQDTIVGKGFRFPLPAEPRQIDPQVSTDVASVTMVAALFEGLARLDEKGNAIPAAATWTISSDGLNYTFKLKESKWSDGSPVTAHDFAFGMQRAVMPSTRSTLAEQLFDIRGAQEVNAGTISLSELGVKAISDDELRITLVEPSDNFLVKTASTPFMPCKKSFFDSTGGRYGLEVKYLLSNGAFFLKKWIHNQSLLLNKHKDYHNADKILPSAVRYMIGETNDPVSLLNKGLLDAAPISESDIPNAKDTGLNLITQQDTIQYIWLNNSIKELNNASVRRAMRSALEWDILYNQLRDEIATPATGFVAPDAMLKEQQPYRTEGNTLRENMMGRQAANELATGLQQLSLSKMPKLTLICSDDDYTMNLARYIVQSWQKNLSLYFDIQPLKESELATRVKVGNYQIALYKSTASGSSPLNVFKSFVTDAIGNISHFSDSSYDAKYTNVALGNATRNEMESLEAMLWKACPSIPISFERRYVAVPPNNSGIIVRSFGGGAFGAPYDFRSAGKLDK